jgi:hypothetical protein
MIIEHNHTKINLQEYIQKKKGYQYLLMILASEKLSPFVYTVK